MTAGKPVGVGGPTWVQAVRRVVSVRMKGRDMGVSRGVLVGMRVWASSRGMVLEWFVGDEGVGAVRLVLAGAGVGSIFLG